jgi:hypothetical protein
MRKTIWLAAVLWLPAAERSEATVYSFSANGAGSYSAGWTGSAGLPDHDGSGVVFGLNFGSAGTMSAVSVDVKITGGWNGDIYAYLSHGSDFAVLLNRSGLSGSDADGYGNRGYDVRLVAGGTDVHWYQEGGGQINANGQLTGEWGADGRVNATDTARSQTLGVFNNKQAEGDWTLFFADLGSGGPAATVVGWSVNVGITAVPEPRAWGAGCVLGLVLVSLGTELRKRRARKKDSIRPESEF